MGCNLNSSSLPHDQSNNSNGNGFPQFDINHINYVKTIGSLLNYLIEAHDDLLKLIENDKNLANKLLSSLPEYYQNNKAELPFNLVALEEKLESSKEAMAKQLEVFNNYTKDFISFNKDQQNSSIEEARYQYGLVSGCYNQLKEARDTYSKELYSMRELISSPEQIQKFIDIGNSNLAKLKEKNADQEKCQALERMIGAMKNLKKALVN